MRAVHNYLNFLKAFVEGKKDMADWQKWWAENSHHFEPVIDRKYFLRLKHQPFRGARELLDECGVDYSPDKTKCQTCGTPLFRAIAKQTTQEEIREFARRANFKGAEQIEKDGWMHPGEYCPNGCTWILNNYKTDLWDKLEKIFKRTHTCSATIVWADVSSASINDYTIYIDGNVGFTSDKDQKPINGEFVRLEPGKHRIVVREADYKKLNRRESNTIYFTIRDGESLSFQINITNDDLQIHPR